MERVLSSGHFDDQAAQGPHVGRRVAHLPAHDLRRHVQDCPRGAIRPAARERVEVLRGAKVGDLHDALSIEQHVGALDVAVHHVVRVQELQREQHLLHDELDLAVRHRDGAAQALERVAGDELHENVHLVACHLRPEVLDEVVVPQLPHHANFRLQRIECGRGLLIHLDPLQAEAGVVGLVDGAVHGPEGTLSNRVREDGLERFRRLLNDRVHHDVLLVRHEHRVQHVGQMQRSEAPGVVDEVHQEVVRVGAPGDAARLHDVLLHVGDGQPLALQDDADRRGAAKVRDEANVGITLLRRCDVT
mmetsp:Transcript_35035/g.108122  ORF Transcript_35035/g.108122 Transcript_35035/m.108122 type:complete len:303 (-) Transcript_35035:37-945(-)